MNKQIKTYIGFSIKSNQIVIGQDRLKASKDKIELIIYCQTASENLVNLAKNQSIKHKCKCVMLDDSLENYTGKVGCKIIGLTNISLAEAIIKQLQNLGERDGK